MLWYASFRPVSPQLVTKLHTDTKRYTSLADRYLHICVYIYIYIYIFIYNQDLQNCSDSGISLPTHQSSIVDHVILELKFTSSQPFPWAFPHAFPSFSPQRPPCSAVVFRGGKPHTAKPRSAEAGHGAAAAGGRTGSTVEVIRAAQRRKEFMAWRPRNGWFVSKDIPQKWIWNDRLMMVF